MLSVSAWYHAVISIQGRLLQSRCIRNDLRFLVLHENLSKDQIYISASVLSFYIMETMSVVGMVNASINKSRHISKSKLKDALKLKLKY